MVAENVTLARPYARAAFELARDAGQLTEWSAALADMAATAANETLKPLLNNPGINARQISEIIVAACGLSDGPMSNFVRLLAEGRRFPALLEISAQFEVFRCEEEKTIDVEVTAAAELDEAQEKKIQEVETAQAKQSAEYRAAQDKVLKSKQTQADAAIKAAQALIQANGSTYNKGAKVG